MKAWAKRAIQSARALFEPVVFTCKLNWLTKKKWDDGAYFKRSAREIWILYAYNSLTDDGENKNNRLAQLSMYSYEDQIGLDVLNALVEGDIPKSEHWYTGLAWPMMTAGYVGAAIEHFEKALEINLSSWVAMEGLAKCYGCLHDYRKAIDWLEQAISVQAAEGFSERSINFYMRSIISSWYYGLGDMDLAVETARFAYLSSKKFSFGDNSTDDALLLLNVKQYIKPLFDMHRYDEIVELLYELDETPTVLNVSLLVGFIQAQLWPNFDVSIYDMIGTIMRDTNDKALEDRMAAAMALSAASGNANGASVGFTNGDLDCICWLDFRAAQWRYRWGLKSDDCIVLFEKLVEKIDERNEAMKQSLSRIRANAAGFLSSMHFQAALTCPAPPSDCGAEPGRDSSSPIRQLNALAKHKQSGAQVYRASYSALLYGAWLRNHAEASEREWRACFGPSIKHAIYLLSDEIPSNDQEAYSELGEMTDKDQKQVEDSGFASNGKDGEIRNLQSEATNSVPQSLHDGAGDVSNGSAQSQNQDIVEMLTTTGEEEQERDSEIVEAQKKEEADEEENPKLTGFKILFSCDGICNSATYIYKELHFCRLCDNVCFCESCVQLPRQNKLPYRICNPDHQMLRVFPLAPAAADMIDSLVARDFAPQVRWLQELNETWG
ncbi:hypothetical protein MMC17_009809 [Xylographa soralifera]|nr:hypothetical protein [Xylographa soralifera]